ncbi:all-trans retinoic acid-induced differentiation factor isoform X4 [Rhineura floridana]|uniref:all-trans retinoic acid-induced differentiation factor isoform X4 n=1 Tax=Rhineura floridana TaxID=261503 RepID=UPI002AC86E75|nr:all-trans retinoic acid-induced differentiation factor isoform X4 [Rhineura floridana]
MAAPGRPWPRSAEWPLLLLRLCLCLVAGGAGALAQVTGTEVRRAASAAASPSPLPVCGCCAGPVRNGSATAALCGSRAGAVRRGRCCLDGPPERETVVGLDLGNCSLLQLCPSFQEASTALVIDLTDNPLGRPPEEAFRGFTQLQNVATDAGLSWRQQKLGQCHHPREHPAVPKPEEPLQWLRGARLAVPGGFTLRSGRPGLVPVPLCRPIPWLQVLAPGRHHLCYLFGIF